MGRPRRIKHYVLSLAFLAIASGAVVLVTWPGVRDVLLPSKPGTGHLDAKVVRPAASDQPTVQLDERGLGHLKVATVALRDFKQEVRDVGVVDFDQDATAAVFPPYQGRIIQPLVDLGDNVEKGQALYTINSPDLLQAESTLIQTAGALDLATKNVGRLRQSVKNGGGAQKDLDQAQTDLQTAVGAYNAAKQALAIFGKTSAEADRVVSSRTVDPVLVVRSPITGTITARNAAPGIFVQPGTAPAPYSVADLTQVRLYDFVSEDESPAIRVGEQIAGRVLAYPDRVFAGTVTAISAAVDPNTHRVQVEALIPNPARLLRPSMFVDLTIRTGAPVRSPAVPANAVVRLGDGSRTVWVAQEKQRFSQRVVKIGLEQDGYDEIVDGVRPGESIVSDGAVYVSNIANANASP